jgi:flagellar hook-length control protein FliK
MSSAAGLVTGMPVQFALQLPPDAAAPLAPGGDFTAAMAAACGAGSEGGLAEGMPEGMQSAAALAWLAGFMSTVQPLQQPPQGGAGLSPDAGLLADSSETPVPDPTISIEDMPATALSFLQEMLQPVMHNVPREGFAPDESAVESADISVAISVATAERAVALAAQPAASVTAVSADSLDADAPADSVAVPAGVIPAAVASAMAAGNAAPAVGLLAAMRALTADAQPDSVVPAQGDPRTGVSINADSVVTSDATAESSMSERFIGALAERVSMRDGASIPAEFDRTAISGPTPNLYTSTKEAVAGTAGHVSSRPEVVHATVASPRWANELGSRLAMMSVRGQHEGSLSLTPEHLGPLEVRISVNQDTTNVWFGAQNADTRAALADAIPRLREMFATSGLALGHAGVSHEMPGQEARQSEASASRAEVTSETADAPVVRAARISTGLLDTWA